MGRKVSLNVWLADHKEVVVEGVRNLIPPFALSAGELAVCIRCACCSNMSAQMPCC